MAGDDLIIYRLGGRLRPHASGVGEKAVRLWQMRTQGLPVPDGLILPVETIAQLLGTWQPAGEAAALAGSEDDNLRRLPAGGGPPAGFEAVLRALRDVDGYRDEMRLAVRSAALGEDSEEASFAGQYATILGVTVSTLWDALLQCYGAWWSPQAIAYRGRRASPDGPPMLSVIVQRQLAPSCAGVAFTRDPVTLDNVVVVEAVPGLGDRLVAGAVTPARWRVTPQAGAVLQFTPGPFPDLGPDPSFLGALVETLTRVEGLFGPALDVEWAVEDGSLFLLQCRSITTGGGGRAVEDAVQGLYTRRVLEDLWSDRMTPMTRSVMFDELSDVYTFKTVLRRLGLQDIAAMPAVEVWNGYAYLSAAVALKVVELLPRALRVREVAEAFPPAIRERAMGTRFRPARALRVAGRMPLLLGDPAILPCLTVPLLQRHLRRVEHELERVRVADYEDRDPEFYATELERVLEQLKRLLVRNQWGYGHATVFLWLLRHVATQVTGRSSSWVLSRLRALPSNVTGRLHRRLEAIAAACDADVRRCLASDRPDAEVWALLTGPLGDRPAVGLMRNLVTDFRHRSGNRDFVHRRWDEEPERVVGFVRAALGDVPPASPPPDRDPGARRTSPLGARLMNACLDVSLARPARRFLALREDLRFGLDKAFHRIRRLLLAIGRTAPLMALQPVGADAVFFLELDELRAILRGTLAADATLPRVRERAAAFGRSHRASPPIYVRFDGRTVHDVWGEGAGSGTGVAASPGVASGRAVVVYGPEDFHKVRAGDILVAYNTDPGWTPLFLRVAGVVVEMGGILNHCAIVAREYGVPAVVGVAGITRRVSDGDTVTVNGHLGVVHTAPPPQRN